jgi:D-glycero-D-manno-heptose 1,7-bisphosphate phosphatase
MSKQKALFLDRDGVINVDYGYVRTKEMFQFVDGILDLCRIAQKRNYLIVIITNQSCIGRGMMLESEFISFTKWMTDKMKNKGVTIAKLYYSPYHSKFGLGEFRKESNMRKPNSGMFIKAKNEFTINMDKSINVGNKYSDILAGLNARIKNNFLLSKDIKEMKYNNKEFHVISHLNEIIAFLEEPL